MILKPSKFFPGIICLLILSVIVACNGYEKHGNQVYYVYWNEASFKHKILIPDADAETFHELEYKSYAVDKNHVYFEAGVIKNADPKTFVALSDYYSKDEKFAFKNGVQIEGAQGKTFDVIDEGPYSRDESDFYFDTLKLHVNNLSSFVILNKSVDFGYWAKDKSLYYINGVKYPLADYKTFEKLEGGYSKDKYRVYFFDSIVDRAESATFKVLEFAKAEDHYAKYDGATRLNIEDPKSFKVLSDEYTKDKLHVYKKNKIVVGADPESFEEVDWKWQKDKSHYFYQGKLMEDIDYNTFELMQNNYAKDKNHVYYYDALVSGADPDTFRVDELTYIGHDRNGCYEGSDKVDCDKVKDE